MFKWIIMALYPILIAIPLVVQQERFDARLATALYNMEQMEIDIDREISALGDSLVAQKESLDSLWEMHPYFNEESLVKLYSFIDRYDYCPGTRFITKSSVNPKMDRELYKALASYTGPSTTITSIYRPKSGKSQHRQKLAVDIRWNESGKLMAEWLLTDEGKQWIEDNSLVIYFENIPERKYRTGIFKQFYMKNPHATGPHIHVAILKKYVKTSSA